MAHDLAVKSNFGGLTTFWQALLKGLRHHAVPHALGLIIILSGFAVMHWSGGSKMTPSVEKFVSKYLVFAATYVLTFVLIAKMVRMVLWEKPDAPLQHLVTWVSSNLTDPSRIANGIHGSVFIFMVMSGFTMWKNQVSVLGGFAWDPAFVDLERLLHFGVLPQDWLSTLATTPWTLKLIDQAYVFWLPVLFGSTLIASWQSEQSDLRWRFLVAFALTWGIGGIATANLFSSAGPVYYAGLHGAPGPYAAYMAYLQTTGIEALFLQQTLWDAHSATPSFSSISAFPSMHVAITTLVFLACRHLSTWIKWIAGCYLAIIMLGSVVLAWHYAVDGYAGALIASASWGVSKALSRKRSA